MKFGYIIAATIISVSASRITEPTIRQLNTDGGYAPYEPEEPTPLEESTPVEAPTPMEEGTWTPMEAPTPMQEPSWTPAEQPIWTPMEEPSWTPAEQPIWTPMEEPSWTPAEQPIWTPMEDPAMPPMEEPSWTPKEEPTVEEPVMSPMDEPTMEVPTMAPHNDSSDMQGSNGSAMDDGSNMFESGESAMENGTDSYVVNNGSKNNDTNCSEDAHGVDGNVSGHGYDLHHRKLNTIGTIIKALVKARKHNVDYNDTVLTKPAYHADSNMEGSGSAMEGSGSAMEDTKDKSPVFPFKAEMDAIQSDGSGSDVGASNPKQGKEYGWAYHTDGSDSNDVITKKKTKNNKGGKAKGATSESAPLEFSDSSASFNAPTLFMVLLATVLFITN